MEKAIRVANVTKKYKLYNDTKERLFDLITPKDYGDDFYALADVSFEIERGDRVGFIGVNGSGKSTLSNIIAGIVPETSGTVQVNGEVSLIAVAAGLKGDLTGRDNIEYKCLMLGFSKSEIKTLEPAIIEFSELGDFIDQPVKSYSSGMRSRLGFAISVNVNPDIIIIDEALSVGDRAFAEKSLDKMKEFKEQNKTMIFVSHSIRQMKQFCEKILWLEYGMVKAYGPVEEVIPKYEAFLKSWKKMNKKEREVYRNAALEIRDKKASNIPINSELKAKLDIQTSKKTKPNSKYIEVLISRLGHFKSGRSYIYNTPTDLTKRKLSDDFKGQVYFIKKKVIYKDELFYLLSEQPSAIRGVIGWVKASRIVSRFHVPIDQDSKIFYIKGTGRSYNRAWGGKNNRVHSDLDLLKDAEFRVNQTDKVGKGIWYRGELSGKTVWVHANHLYKNIKDKT